MKLFNIGLLRTAIEEINFVEVFRLINPHAPDAIEQLEKFISIKADSLLTLLLDKSSRINEKVIFQNMFAIAYEDPLLLMAIWRALLKAANKNKSLDIEVNRIKGAIYKSNLSKTGLKILLTEKITELPTIDVIKGITPALNFRYWLATQNLGEINIIDLIRFPQISKKISRLAWQREVKKLSENSKYKQLPNSIDKNTYDNLRVSEKMLLASDSEIFSKFTVDNSNRKNELEKLNNILKNQNEIAPILFSIIRCIQKRELYKANKLLDQIDTKNYQGELVSRFSPILRKKITEYVYPKVESWQHLNTKSLTKLHKLCENQEIATYFNASAKKVATLLSEKKLILSDIHPKDLSLIRSNWTDEEKYNLIKNGIYKAFTYIPDEVAIKLLPQLLENISSKEPSELVLNKISGLILSGKYFDELLPYLIEGKYSILTELFRSDGSYHRSKYSQRVIKYFGSKNDISCVDNFNENHVKELLEYLNNPDVIDPLAYQKSLASLLTINLLKHLPGFRPYSWKQLNKFLLWANLALSFTKLCSEGGKHLTESLKPDQITILMNEVHLPDNLWKKVIDHVQDQKCQLLLRSSNFKRLNAKEFLKNLKLYPSLIDYIGIKNKAQFKEFKDKSDKVSTLICLRKSPKSLKKIQENWTKSEFRDIALAACDYLPPKSRQRGYLSLIANLDKSITLPLAALMASSKKDASAGNKLNHLYNSFEIPKKNGAMRTITAPFPILKRVQKSVLTNLLNTIMAHPAANGFCIRKSIVTNALPHTNKKIVANCDITNCFPSVSWPLIYRALKTSFENLIGIEAVSLLTDICSKDGALPMGAPTSPALLNIVLYKTDVILSKSSSKFNCDYTRYADDLTFSGDENAIKLIGLAEISLNKIGLKIDPIKTNIFRRGRRQSVTGLVVNNGVSVNKKYRKLVRAAAHRIEQNQVPTWLGKAVTKSSIRGRIDFINSVQKKVNEKN